MTFFKVFLNSPSKSIVLNKVRKTTIQTQSGIIELLPNHSKLLSQITISYLDVFLEDTNNQSQSYFINGGILMFDKELHITSSEIVLADHFDKGWLESLRIKKIKIKEQIQKAMDQSQYYNQTEAVDIKFLLAEERLAKIQFFGELLK